MSLDFVEIELDRPRKIRFSFSDLRTLETRLGNLPFQSILEMLSQMNLNALAATLAIGLRWDDKTISPSKVDALMDEYMKKHQTVVPVLEAIVKAFEVSGITGGASEDGDRPTT